MLRFLDNRQTPTAMGNRIRQGVRWGIFLSSATTALFLFVSAAEADGSVVINEIMWDETEYVELRNTMGAAVSLNGWSLARQRPGEERKTLVTFGSSDAVAANSFWLIEKSEAATTVPADKLVSALTLLNSGEQLILLDEHGRVVDTANPVGAWLAGENTSVGVAMERNNPPADGAVLGSWHTSTGIEGGRSGTPRMANTEPPVNTAPEAVAGVDIAATVGTSVSFSAEDSTDSDGDELTYSWDFGDGSSGSGPDVSHSYAAAGSYTATLTVGDGKLTDTNALVVTVTAPVYSDALVINEFLPDPVGADTTAEFIELFNTGADSVDLAGWKLDDADGGSVAYSIPAGTTIRGGAYLSFSRSETKVALNNEGDTVRLLAPSGTVRASTTFGKSDEGQSFNRVDSSYVLSTTPTPGQSNVITATAEADEGKSSSRTSSSATSTTDKTGRVAGTTVKTVSLSEVREEEQDSWVTVEGVVSAPPGVFGEQLLYLAGSGIQVYFSKGSWPKLELGSRVKLTAQVGRAYGEARLKLSEAKDLTIMKTEAPPEPHLVETGEIDVDKEGWLVTVAGEVVETDGDTFYVDDGSGKVKVFIKETTGIDKPPMKKGSTVTLTGVVSHTTSGYRLLPRFQSDVRLGLVAGLTHFPATGPPPPRLRRVNSSGWSISPRWVIFKELCGNQSTWSFWVGGMVPRVYSEV